LQSSSNVLSMYSWMECLVASNISGSHTGWQKHLSMPQSMHMLHRSAPTLKCVIVVFATMHCGQKYLVVWHPLPNFVAFQPDDISWHEDISKLESSRSVAVAGITKESVLNVDKNCSKQSLYLALESLAKASWQTKDKSRD
jgi:hypothetical protein